MLSFSPSIDKVREQASLSELATQLRQQGDKEEDNDGLEEGLIIGEYSIDESDEEMMEDSTERGKLQDIDETADLSPEEAVDRLVSIRNELWTAIKNNGSMTAEELDIRLQRLDLGLKRAGVEMIEPEVGEMVDGKTHMVHGIKSSKRPNGEILEIKQPGYKIGDVVGQPARVVISDDPSKEGSIPQQSTNILDTVEQRVDEENGYIGTTESKERDKDSQSVEVEDETHGAFEFKKLVLPKSKHGLPVYAGDSEPYLQQIDGGYAVERYVIEWLGWLTSNWGRAGTAATLTLYAKTGWISPAVRDQLHAYLDGLPEAVSGTEVKLQNQLSVTDHVRSLRYIRTIKETQSSEVSSSGI